MKWGMSVAYYEESAKIVTRAIHHLGSGNAGLAKHLNKNPSLVSRYASGEVRPKAEILLKCIQLIGTEDFIPNTSALTNEQGYAMMLDAVGGLSPLKDRDLINAILGVLALAKKVSLGQGKAL